MLSVSGALESNWITKQKQQNTEINVAGATFPEEVYIFLPLIRHWWQNKGWILPKYSPVNKYICLSYLQSMGSSKATSPNITQTWVRVPERCILGGFVDSTLEILFPQLLGSTYRIWGWAIISPVAFWMSWTLEDSFIYWIILASLFLQGNGYMTYAISEKKKKRSMPNSVRLCTYINSVPRGQKQNY